MPLLDLAVCPNCRAAIFREAHRWSCTRCGAQFRVDDGVRLLVVDYDEYKRAQASFFDSNVDPEYEINRPHGTPLFHEWLLREKFRRSIASIRKHLAGASVLVICGGSGLDAELLAAVGANVLCTDISLGATKRAAVRSARFGVHFEVAVADAETLPFADCSFDFVYVHDGLHHLEHPLRAVTEMSRVANGGVCITEPAQAAVTRLAVHAGIATDEEAAGNRVERINEAQVRTLLAAAGLRTQTASRYLMYYAHEPGIAAHLLSRSVPSAAAKAALRAVNAVAGRAGNKLTIQATRA